MKGLLGFLAVGASFFTLSLVCCTTEFRGWTADGKKLINYEFSSSHVDSVKEVFLRVDKTDVEVEKNAWCSGYGYCNDWEDGYGWYHDCDGTRAYVKYKWYVEAYRKDLQLTGGRLIPGEVYYKERDEILEQAKCIVP